jgi:hypothetical protein
VGAKDPGELPATFTVTSGDGTKLVRVQVSEATTVTPAGGTSIRIGSSGEFVTTPLTIAANTNQDIYFSGAGSFTIPKRKLVTYLRIAALGSSVITGDITGMDITYLFLENLGSSTITGNITGMELTSLYLNNIDLSMTYGTNPLNITNSLGIWLRGSTVFATAAEYEQLIIDAASGTWSPVGSRPFRIDAGTNETDPGWDNVKAYVAILLTKAAWTVIPSAWLEDNGGSWPSTWNEYEG